MENFVTALMVGMETDVQSPGVYLRQLPAPTTGLQRQSVRLYHAFKETDAQSGRGRNQFQVNLKLSSSENTPAPHREASMRKSSEERRGQLSKLMSHFNLNAGKYKQIYEIGINELRQIDPKESCKHGMEFHAKCTIFIKGCRGQQNSQSYQSIPQSVLRYHKWKIDC